MNPPSLKNPIDEPAVYYGGENVFADIGLPNPDEILAKAKIGSVIQDVIEFRGLTQSKAADIMGIDQAEASKIVRGRLGEFSMDRLLSFLLRLGLDVDIVIHTQPQSERQGEMTVACA